MSDLDKLLDKAKSGDKKAKKQLWEFLTVRFEHFAILYLWQHGKDEALDVAHDALKAVMEKHEIQTFTEGFAQWTHGVLINKIRQFIRKKKKQKKLEKELVLIPRPYNPTPEEEYKYIILKRKLFNCLKQIKTKKEYYFDVLKLVLKGNKTDVICQKLGIEENNFYVSLNRGRNMLKKCLETGRI